MNVYLIKSFSLRLLQDEILKIVGQNPNVVRMNMDEMTINDIINECGYYSLLNETKYVVVNNFKLTKENNLITEYLDNPNPNTVLILVTDSFDKRSVIYKKVQTNGHLVLIEQVKDISSKISNYAKSKDIIIDYLAITKLLENNLNNYDLVLNEIDKISVITSKITLHEVNKYTTRLISEDNFEFCDAVIKKDYKQIDGFLADFINLKGELLPFIALLAGQYRVMYATKCLEGTSEQIAKKLDIHPYRVKLAKEKGVLYSKEELQKKLLDLCDLDYQIKTTNIDKYLLFKIFLVNL